MLASDICDDGDQRCVLAERRGIRLLQELAPRVISWLDEAERVDNSARGYGAAQDGDLRHAEASLPGAVLVEHLAPGRAGADADRSCFDLRKRRSRSECQRTVVFRRDLRRDVGEVEDDRGWHDWNRDRRGRDTSSLIRQCRHHTVCRPKTERAASGQHNCIGALHKSPRLQKIELSRPRSRPSHLGGTQGGLIERDDGATRLRRRKGRVPYRDALDVPNNPGYLYHVAVTPGKAMVMRPVKC